MFAYHLGLFHMPETSTVLIGMTLLVALAVSLGYLTRVA